MDIPHFYLSIHQFNGHWLFYFLVYYEHLCTSFLHGHMLSFLLGIYIGIVGSYLWQPYVLPFKVLFYKAVASFMIPQAVFEGSSFSTSSPALVIVHLICYRHPYACA